MRKKSDIIYEIEGFPRLETPGADKLINGLPEILEQDEKILGITAGGKGGGVCLVVATPQRILFLKNNSIGKVKKEDLYYNQINSIDFKIGALFAAITIETSVSKIKINTCRKETVQGFVKTVEELKDLKTIYKEPNKPDLPVNAETPISYPQEEDANLHKLKKSQKAGYRTFALGLVIVFAVIFAFMQFDINSQNKAAKITEEQAIEIDDTLWELVLRSEAATLSLQDGINLYGNSSLDVYDLAKSTETIQQGLFSLVNNVDHMGSASLKKYKTEAEYYISQAKAFSTNVYKYIDKQEMKYLSNAKQFLESLPGCATNVMAARNTFLNVTKEKTQ